MPNQPNLVFRSATVLDGTGAEPIVADVAVTNDRISHIGQAPLATRKLPARVTCYRPDSSMHTDMMMARLSGTQI